jgi:hypothetical protein
MKNINNRKMISVMEDMLNVVSILFFDCSAMLFFFLKQINKLNACIFHIMDKL